MKTRAIKGGQFGANGEWYEGGKFINTIPENIKGSAKSFKKTSKRQVAQYSWEVCPEGKSRTIWSKFAGFELCLVKNDISLVSDQTLNYYGLNRGELVVLMNRFQNGERWV